MTEEENLLARIGELAGQINRRKNQDIPRRPLLHPSSSTPAYPHRSAYSYAAQSTPYGSGAGDIFQNRSLIANNQGKSEISSDENLSPAPRGVAKHGRGAKTWISEDALRQKLERRKQFVKTVQPRGKEFATQQVRHSENEKYSPPVNYVTVDDIPFQVTNGGGKLLRTNEKSTSAGPTPKEAVVSGVIFRRTKNGNLLRTRDTRHGPSQPIGKSKLCRQYTSTGTPAPSRHTMPLHKDYFCSHGRRRCSRGNKCFGIHDIHRTAICQSVLRGTRCSAGDDCDLTHKSSSQVAPICLHFLRGNCTKPLCPYSHAPVNPSAPICRDFAYLGYCERGSHCSQRHLRECPGYSSGSGCRNEHCLLPHVDRASQMRRNAANKAENSDDMDVDDVISDEEAGNGIDSDDMDSSEKVTEFEELFGARTSGISHQQDFVGLT